MVDLDLVLRHVKTYVAVLSRDLDMVYCNHNITTLLADSSIRKLMDKAFNTHEDISETVETFALSSGQKCNVAVNLSFFREKGADYVALCAIPLPSECETGGATGEVDLNEIVKSVDEKCRPLVQPRAILNYVLGAAECRVKTDSDMLCEVLHSLVSRACRNTVRGSVTFGYELKSEGIYFFVKDTGESPAYAANKSGDTVASEPGLQNCANHVKALGGVLKSESARGGKGCMLSFTLPLSVEENPAHEEPPHHFEPAASATPEHMRPRHARGPRQKILVAEDNESNYFLFLSILEDEYELVHANDGQEAVDLFSETKPDLILMDINMPRMDGYEATRHIRQLSQEVPIIAVTAYAFASDRTRIMESGFDSYISKPVNAERLLSEIERCLNERK